MINKKIETKGAELFLEDNKYLNIIFKPKISIELDIAEEIAKATSSLANDIPHGNIVDLKDLLFMSNDARKFFAAQDNKKLFGVAIINNSKLKSGLANLYFRFTKRNVENKLFTNIDDAKAWLDSKM